MNENIASFLKVLDPADNSTGGGTASAVAGAMAAALVGMVARLSIGKKDMEPESFYQPIVAEAERLKQVLFNGGNKDSLAFEQVQAAFRKPRETQDQKTTRQVAIEEAMVHAASVPLENGKSCRQVLELWKKLQGRSNPNAASDLECAGLLAQAGLQGCMANVEINLSSIKNKGLIEELQEEIDTLREFVSKIK